MRSFIRLFTIIFTVIVFPVGSFQEIKGLDLLDKVISIDQSPIGRTPRSNPATYTGLFTPIRELFAECAGG